MGISAPTSWMSNQQRHLDLGGRGISTSPPTSKEGSGTRRCHRHQQDHHNVELKIPPVVFRAHPSPAISTWSPTTPHEVAQEDEVGMDSPPSNRPPPPPRCRWRHPNKGWCHHNTGTEGPVDSRGAKLSGGWPGSHNCQSSGPRLAPRG
jgi:hypothetical protein